MLKILVRNSIATCGLRISMLLFIRSSPGADFLLDLSTSAVSSGEIEFVRRWGKFGKDAGISLEVRYEEGRELST